jgi:hypothetical protein
MKGNLERQERKKKRKKKREKKRKKENVITFGKFGDQSDNRIKFISFDKSQITISYLMYV